MAAALDVNWTEVQMLALTVGVREAARQLGISEEAVKKRCTREGWISERPINVPAPPTVIRHVPNVPNAAKVLQEIMREDALGGRAAQLKLGRKTLEKLAAKDVDELLTPEMSTVAKNYGSLHAQAAGYSSTDGVTRLDLRVTGQRSNVETIEAEVVQDNGFVE